VENKKQDTHLKLVSNLIELYLKEINLFHKQKNKEAFNIFDIMDVRMANFYTILEEANLLILFKNDKDTEQLIKISEKSYRLLNKMRYDFANKCVCARCNLIRDRDPYDGTIANNTFSYCYAKYIEEYIEDERHKKAQLEVQNEPVLMATLDKGIVLYQFPTHDDEEYEYLNLYIFEEISSLDHGSPRKVQKMRINKNTGVMEEYKRNGSSC